MCLQNHRVTNSRQRVGPVSHFYILLLFWKTERLKHHSSLIYTDLPKFIQIVLKFPTHILDLSSSLPINVHIRNRILTRCGFRTQILIGPTNWLLLLQANIQPAVPTEQTRHWQWEHQSQSILPLPRTPASIVTLFQMQSYG